MEHLGLALRIVIGQAYETAAAFQDIGLGCGMWDVGCGMWDITTGSFAGSVCNL